MSPPTAPISFRALYGRQIIRDTLHRELDAVERKFANLPPGQYGYNFLFDSVGGGERAAEPKAPTDLASLKFCIVGAGAAGLFLAMLLTEAGISYDLIEASDRVGGRMYTKEFSDAPHDYYDIGAMRYPKIPLMDRTFKLFDELEITRIKYYLDGNGNNPSMFNDILGPGDPSTFDHFRVSQENGGVVMDWAVKEGASNILNKAFAKYIEPLKKNFNDGFKALVKEADQFSTREYLRTQFEYEVNGVMQRGLDFHTIQWLETNQTSSGLFDQAFTESIMDFLDFSYCDDVHWECIEGGTRRVTEAIIKKIGTPPEMNTPVTRIALKRDPGRDDSKSKMVVDVMIPGSGKQTREYDTVFNTTTLGCAARMDLSEAELHPAQKDAIRALHYDASCKVAIRFKTAWWITKCGITEGGTASSDLPLRTCVYPSYNLHDDHNIPTVLLASYTWAQDAQRIGSLVDNSTSPAGEETLKDLILRDLARLHSAKGIDYEYLCDQYLTHHAYDWYSNPYTSGAFALFGPGQFRNLYPYLTRPAADSRLHFVGEASSVHHAWIVGALNSAQRALEYALERFDMREEAEKIRNKWGPVDEVEWGHWDDEKKPKKEGQGQERHVGGVDRSKYADLAFYSPVKQSHLVEDRWRKLSPAEWQVLLGRLNSQEAAGLL